MQIKARTKEGKESQSQVPGEYELLPSTSALTTALVLGLFGTGDVIGTGTFSSCFSSREML